MTDAEKAALEWLERIHGPEGTINAEHKRVLFGLLAEPRLPAEPSDKAINAMLNAPRCFGELSTQQWRDAYRALYAHLTKPKTKTVEVWHVEYVTNGAPQIRVCGDERTAKGYLLPHENFQCIRVTGPHKHEVPDD